MRVRQIACQSRRSAWRHGLHRRRLEWGRTRRRERALATAGWNCVCDTTAHTQRVPTQRGSVGAGD
eukprot:374812-Prymnesium_polylepis.1